MRLRHLAIGTTLSICGALALTGPGLPFASALVLSTLLTAAFMTAVLAGPRLYRHEPVIIVEPQPHSFFYLMFRPHLWRRHVQVNNTHHAGTTIRQHNSNLQTPPKVTHVQVNQGTQPTHVAVRLHAGTPPTVIHARSMTPGYNQAARQIHVSSSASHSQRTAIFKSQRPHS